MFIGSTSAKLDPILALSLKIPEAVSSMVKFIGRQRPLAFAMLLAFLRSNFLSSFSLSESSRKKTQKMLWDIHSWNETGIENHAPSTDQVLKSSPRLKYKIYRKSKVIKTVNKKVCIKARYKNSTGSQITFLRIQINFRKHLDRKGRVTFWS